MQLLILIIFLHCVLVNILQETFDIIQFFQLFKLFQYFPLILQVFINFPIPAHHSLQRKNIATVMINTITSCPIVLNFIVNNYATIKYYFQTLTILLIYLLYKSNVTESLHLSHLTLQKSSISCSDKNVRANSIDLLEL